MQKMRQSAKYAAIAYSHFSDMPTRDSHYSTIEKECLTVWAIQKFENFLYGKSFILDIDWLTDWRYWTLLHPLKGWIAKYNMYVNTKIQNTNNRKYNTKNMHNVTKI